MSRLKFRIRYDYEGRSKSGWHFGKKSCLEAAEDNRQKKVALMRNIPNQGIIIDEIEMGSEVYTIFDEYEETSISFAPVTFTLQADSLDSIIKYVMKEEFRTIEIIEPSEVSLSKLDLERLMRRVNEELLTYKHFMQRKRDNWK